MQSFQCQHRAGGVRMTRGEKEMPRRPIGDKVAQLPWHKVHPHPKGEEWKAANEHEWPVNHVCRLRLAEVRLKFCRLPHVVSISKEGLCFCQSSKKPALGSRQSFRNPLSTKKIVAPCWPVCCRGCVSRPKNAF